MECRCAQRTLYRYTMKLRETAGSLCDQALYWAAAVHRLHANSPRLAIMSPLPLSDCAFEKPWGDAAREVRVHMPRIFILTASIGALAAPQRSIWTQGNSDCDYFYIAPETTSEGMKSKIYLGEHICRLPIWRASRSTPPFSLSTTHIANFKS